MGNLSRQFKHLSYPLILTTLLAGLLCAGCGKPASDSAKASGQSGSKPAEAGAPEQTAPPVNGPEKDQKACFACNGEGAVACRAPGCKSGKVDCPAPCLKLTRGTWVHMNVAGHSPDELWQKFPNSSGKGGYQAWNQHHVGEVVVMQNGQAVNIGQCKVCGGTTKAACTICKASGKRTCDICTGKKFVPLSWTPTDNPWLNSQPDLLRLTDDRVLLGKVVLSSGEDRTIRTRDGKITHVDASEILPSSTSNSVPTCSAK